MDLHAACCTLLLLTSPGVCFGQELILPDILRTAVGESVVISPLRIPNPPYHQIRWRINTTTILVGPPNGILIQPPYTDRASLDPSTLALELLNLFENDTGEYYLTVETDTDAVTGQTSLHVLERENAGGESLSAGVIAGIVIGVLLGVAGIAGLIFYFMKVKELPKANSKGNKQSGAADNTDEDDSNYENMVCFKNKNTGLTEGGSGTQMRHTPQADTGVIYENI